MESILRLLHSSNHVLSPNHVIELNIWIKYLNYIFEIAIWVIWIGLNYLMILNWIFCSGLTPCAVSKNRASTKFIGQIPKSRQCFNRSQRICRLGFIYEKQIVCYTYSYRREDQKKQLFYHWVKHNIYGCVILYSYFMK